jgi:hypothetical protein
MNLSIEPGIPRLGRALTYRMGRKTAGAIARTPTIYFSDLELPTGKTLHQGGDKALIVRADSMPQFRQSRAIQLFRNCQDKFAPLRVCFFNAQNADAHFP